MTAPWTDSYVGLPFRDGGRDRSGVDCWGLVRLVFREQLSIDLPDFAEIRSKDWRGASRAIADATSSTDWLPVMRGAEQPFDVVVMRGHSDGARVMSIQNHVGVIVPGGSVLHAEEGTDAIAPKLDSVNVKHRIVGVYRYHVLA